jgi:hypothetical protein
MKKLLLVVAAVVCVVYGNSQQVAINTDGSTPTDPKAMLEIKRSVYSKLKVRSTSFGDTSALEFSNRNAGNLGTDYSITARREQGLYFTTTSDLAANTNDSLFTMLLNGNIGIGTKTPVYPLQVNGGGASTSLMNFTTNTTGMGAADGLLLGVSGSNAIMSNLENGYLRLGTNNLTRVAIDASGNVGVGTLAPGYKLDVAGDVNLTGTLRLNGATGTTGQVLTSNGASDPTWKGTALSNTTRFAFEVSQFSPGTSSTSTGGIFSFADTKYNLDPASVTFSGNDLTISKSGLYHFEFFYSTQFFYTSSALTQSPEHDSYIAFGYAGGLNHYVQYNEPLRHRVGSNSWWCNGKASVDIHIVAPKTLHFYSLFSNLAGPTNSVTQTGHVYGHLISE